MREIPFYRNGRFMTMPPSFWIGAVVAVASAVVVGYLAPVEEFPYFPRVAGWNRALWFWFGAHGIPMHIEVPTTTTAIPVDTVDARAVTGADWLLVVPPVTALLAGALAAVLLGVGNVPNGVHVGVVSAVGYCGAALFIGYLSLVFDIPPMDARISPSLDAVSLLIAAFVVFGAAISGAVGLGKLRKTTP